MFYKLKDSIYLSVIVFLIYLVYFLIEFPNSFISLYLINWHLINISSISSTLFLCTAFFLMYRINNNLEKDNFYKKWLIIIFTFSLILFSVFIVKIIGLSEKYLFYFDFFVLDENTNILTGLGIGISALLAMFTMLYQNENINIDNFRKSKDIQEQQKKILLSILNKIEVLVDSEIEILEDKRGKSQSNLDSIDEMSNSVKIILKDFEQITNYYNFIDDFRSLNKSEQQIKMFESELNDTKTISTLIDILKEFKIELSKCINIRD